MVKFRPSIVIERHSCPPIAFNFPKIFVTGVSAQALQSSRVASLLKPKRASGAKPIG